MTYYWESDGTVKMLPRLSEMTGEVIDGSKIEPVALLSVSKKPVYLGTSRFKTYIIAPKPGEFLKLKLSWWYW